MKPILIPALLALSLPLAQHAPGSHEPAPAPRPASPATVDTATVRAAVRLAEQQTGGVIGVHVRHLESGETFSARGGEPFMMASVGKVPVAIHVLRQVERGRVRLDSVVRLDAARMAGGDNAFRRRVSAGSRVTVAELLEAAISDSDNTAANELLHLVGGPGAVTADLREMGFAEIRVDRDYGQLGAPTSPSDTRDTATPQAVTQLLAALWNGRLMGRAETQRLLGWMAAARTSTHRIVAGVPRGTAVAHKTGTWMRDGQPGPSALNDVGVITLPGGRGHLAVAVFVRDARPQTARTEAAMAQITRAVYAHWAQGAR
jgi:beta-lactamase class A